MTNLSGWLYDQINQTNTNTKSCIIGSISSLSVKFGHDAIQEAFDTHTIIIIGKSIDESPLYLIKEK